MNLLGTYRNGNYNVSLFDDGTKIRENAEDTFISSFPECIDIKITNRCDMQCPFCHENSTPDGLHADLNSPFIDTLMPFTEVAIGGGNPLAHPGLVPFLCKLKERDVIANMTVNQAHFLRKQDEIRHLIDVGLIRGLGVSLCSVDADFINLIKQYKNAVIHVINGVVGLNDLRRLYGYNLKILILGYKQIRRGKDYYSEEVVNNKKTTYDNIIEISRGFDVVSFDNLAIEQLCLRRLFTKKAWSEFYMGNDGEFTMYIDLVNKEFSRSSTTLIRHPIMNDIANMFNIVKQEKTK